ncbi:MAG: type II toxin-antitoxin system PemK/MazF family toxin [Spirochaetaceae bacterium]|nr:type II toxin-antitoxin system PemK/MazF family toxin [Spirochaetaceae bacterium]
MVDSLIPGSVIDMDIGNNRWMKCLIVSRLEYNRTFKLVLLTPIVHKRTSSAFEITFGDMVVLADQVRSIDLANRGFRVVNKVPQNVLEGVRRVLRRIID